MPKGTKLAPKPEAIPDWDTLTADEKRLFARQAEVFAAFVEMTDHEIGRVIEAIEDIGAARQHADLLHRTATTAPAPRAAATACSAR